MAAGYITGDTVTHRNGMTGTVMKRGRHGRILVSWKDGTYSELEEWEQALDLEDNQKTED